MDTRLLCATIFLLSWAGLAAIAQEQNFCLVCHSEIKVDYSESIHATSNVTCVACHGGDPTTLDSRAAHALEALFRSTPQRAEIPQLCASCHSDPVKMKPYGLRTDQYAEYQTSQHGKLLAQGDTRVAVCTDCHMAHRILPAWEPRSTVHFENIPSTCARCHAQRDQGVHSAALAKGNTRAPTCATCHGAHGAAPPGVENVSQVCGTCHMAERAHFAASPHKKPMDAQNIAECASCHGSHTIEPTDRKLFDTVCTSCHGTGSRAHIVSQRLKTLLLAAEESLKEATHLLEQAQQRAVDVSAYRSRLIEARSYFLQALPVQHSLDIPQMEELTRRAKSIADDVRSSLHSLQGVMAIRILGLTLVWVFLLLLIIVIYLALREQQGERL